MISNTVYLFLIQPDLHFQMIILSDVHHKQVFLKHVKEKEKNAP